MLVLRLQTPTDAEPAWAVVNGNQPADWQHGSWATLLPLTRGQTVVLLIPSRYVLLTRTNINTRNQKQLKQALPYALEDALADDPEEQHIVWQAQADSAQVDVAIINRAQLRLWIQALKAQQITVDSVLPDVFALPWEPDTVTLWQQGEQAWVRTGWLSGFGVSSHALPLIVPRLQHAEEPTTLRLFSDQDTTWAQTPAFTITAETQAEQLQLANLEPALKLNLLNGLAAEGNQQFQQQWRRWRVAAGLLIACSLLAAGLYSTESLKLQRQLDQLDAENLQLFTELFPDSGTVDPRSLKNRVASELAALKGKGTGNTGNSPLAQLTVLASALSSSQGVEITEIRSQNASLAIELRAPDQQAIEDLRENLESTLGNPVEMQSSRTADSVKANLTLGEAS